MKEIKKSILKKIAKTAYAAAKTEADSACMCFGYQPVMPKKVKELSCKK